MKKQLFRFLTLILALCLCFPTPAEARGIFATIEDQFSDSSSSDSGSGSMDSGSSSSGSGSGSMDSGSSSSDSGSGSMDSGSSSSDSGRGSIASGSGASDPHSIPSGSGSSLGSYIPYSQMEYQRPDLQQLQSVLEDTCLLAEGSDSASLLEGISLFYDEYDWFFTASALADIRYSGNLSDKYWEEEYNFCSNATPTVQRMLDTLYAALAVSPCKNDLEAEFFGEGFFDDNVEQLWDDELVTLMERENQLISQYYTQYSQSNSLLDNLYFHSDQMAQTLVDLINVRNQLAEYAGFDSYESFANDFYYYRDYTPEEMSSYLELIRNELVPIYLDAWQYVPEAEEMEIDQALAYLRSAAQAMGGTVKEAFSLMEQAGLYDISPGDNKHATCFELYLTSYQEPFLFLNPDGMDYDCLTLSHEFGHFCNDYASSGSSVGIDVSEIFSQGFEYLTLCYHPQAGNLIPFKMADALSTYVEQACYAKFEQQMYRLEQPTVEALCQLYEEICGEFGMVDEYFSPWDFVTIPHFFTDPMYICSYIISNDAALQLYQLEQQAPGKGLQLYQQSLDTQQPYFLAFLEEAGLESPFAPGRLEEVAAFFRDTFCAA